MIPYIVIYIYLLILLLPFRPCLLKVKPILLFTFFLFFLFSGVRYNVGMDYDNYNEIFNVLRGGENFFGHSVDRLEPITLLLIKIVELLGVDNQFIFLIYAFFTLGGIFYFIDKLSPYKELSVFIFFTVGIFYFSTFNGIRQWLALSFFLVASVSYLDGKIKRSVFFIIIAFFAHYSAVFIVFCFPFLFTRWRFYVFFLFSVIAFSFSQVILYIISYTPYSIYMENIRFSQSGDPFFLFVYFSILLFFPISFRYFNRAHHIDQSVIFLLNMCLLSCVSFLILFFMGVDFLTSMRLNMYFQMQLIILIPVFLLRIKDYEIKFSFLVFILFFLSFVFYKTIFINGQKYKLVPYQTVLNLH